MTKLTCPGRSRTLLASGVILAAALAGCSAVGGATNSAAVTSSSTPDDETDVDRYLLPHAR